MDLYYYTKYSNYNNDNIIIENNESSKRSNMKRVFYEKS